MTTKLYLLAQMELKNGDVRDERDIGKSVLMSILSGIVLKKEVKIVTPIEIPFIIGHASRMYLYVTTVHTDGREPTKGNLQGRIDG